MSEGFEAQGPVLSVSRENQIFLAFWPLCLPLLV
jgi:hypothetical protein